MDRYLSKVQVDLDKLSEWTVMRVSRTENTKVDTLVRITATLPVKEVVLLLVYLQATSSIAATLVCSTCNTNINWMHEIETHLWICELPEEEKQAHKIRVPTSP